MPTTWHPVEGTFRIHQRAVRELCEQHFGQEYKEKRDQLTGKVRSNHGNWRFTLSAAVQLRYKKDLVWFALAVSHLVDPKPADWPWRR
jgi:hypothetical protein